VYYVLIHLIFRVIYTDCGGNFYQDIGELQVPSGNVAQQYPTGKLCTWTIQVSSDKVVDIEFTELSLDSTDGCEKNYVKVSIATELF
jgi:hypothetical protein